MSGFRTQGPLPTIQRQLQRLRSPTRSLSPDPIVDWAGAGVGWGDGRLLVLSPRNPF